MCKGLEEREHEGAERNSVHQENRVHAGKWQRLMLEKEEGPEDEGNCRSHKGTILGGDTPKVATEARVGWRVVLGSMVKEWGS